MMSGLGREAAVHDLPLYSTPPEVAAIVRVKADKVRRWIELGELPAADVGDKSRPRYRIARADLLAFLDRRSGAKPVVKQKRRKRTESALPERY